MSQLQWHCDDMSSADEDCESYIRLLGQIWWGSAEFQVTAANYLTIQNNDQRNKIEIDLRPLKKYTTLKHRELCR
jgi:hypothetical protein